MDKKSCNIDIAGRRQRTRAAKFTLALALALSAYNLNSERAARRYPIWIVIQLLFTSAAITYQQVLDQTCVLHGMLGTEEEGPDSLKPVKITDEERADILRTKAVWVVIKGVAWGSALAAISIGVPELLAVE